MPSWLPSSSHDGCAPHHGTQPCTIVIRPGDNPPGDHGDGGGAGGGGQGGQEAGAEEGAQEAAAAHRSVSTGQMLSRTTMGMATYKVSRHKRSSLQDHFT